ncbi:MAG: DivIVA domain-containing protein [Chloroherpetonaceae bacterium]|nr:DivIVA domain-containing protein [Chloroherpetonaceae bacterium]
MKLTPIDIKKQTFNRVLRGYDPEEVEAFLGTVAKQWEETLAEQDALKRKLYELEGQVQKFKEVESILHQTLAQAQQSTASVVENAKREAELIRQEAQMKAAQILERAKNEAIALSDDIQRLNAQKHEIVQKLRLLLASQLELLNSFAADEDAYIVNQIAARKQMRLQAQASTSQPDLAPTDAPPRSEPSPAPAPSVSSMPSVSSTAADTTLEQTQSEKTTRYEVPVETYKGSVSKRHINIDEILNSLE